MRDLDSEILNRQMIRLAVARMTFYHGTQIENAKSILKKGLRLAPEGRGGGWGGGSSGLGDAIFITPEFGVAARYAVGTLMTWTPVVFEFLITSPRRFKKRNIRYDPMDRRQHGDMDMDENVEAVIDDLDRLSARIGKAIRARFIMPLKLRVDTADDIEMMDGLSLVKLVAKRLRDEHGVPWRQAIGLINKMRPRKFGEFVEVRRDGTLKMSAEFYETREQLIYRQNIPPQAIKKVWVPTNFIRREVDRDVIDESYEDVVLLGQEQNSLKEYLMDALNGVECPWRELENFGEDEYYAKLSDFELLNNLLTQRGLNPFSDYEVDFSSLKKAAELIDEDRDNEENREEAQELLEEYNDSVKDLEYQIREMVEDYAVEVSWSALTPRDFLKHRGLILDRAQEKKWNE